MHLFVDILISSSITYANAKLYAVSDRQRINYSFIIEISIIVAVVAAISFVLLFDTIIYQLFFYLRRKVNAFLRNLLKYFF